jgi:hypothetical protein
MKKGLAVFSGSAVVHKLMQDGTVVLGTAANPASVTISGSLTASANSIEVSNVGGEFTNTTLGGILVELKNSGSASSGSLKSYIDAQDIVVGNAAAAALGAYTASNNAALATEVADRIAGDTSVRNDLSAALITSSLAASSSLEGVRVDLQGQIDVLAGADLSGTLSSIADIKSFLDGEAGGVEGILTGFNDLSIAVNAISGALSQEIIDRAADVDAEQQRAEGVEEDLQDQINSLTSGSTQAVDNLRADFNTYTGSANGRLDTLESDLADEITRATGAEATLTSDLAAEVSRASGVEAGLQAQIDSASFSVNGMSVDPFGGSFTIVSSSNIAVASAAGVVTVSLKDSVSITGSLSAAQLSASAGLNVVGGASVAGGLTVSSGDMNVSQGAVSVKMTRAQAAARTAQDGDMFYLTDTTNDNASTWPRGKAWYFRQDGAWFDAPFFQE